MTEIITRRGDGVRTDVPMDGIHQVRKDLETLDTILSTQPQGFRTTWDRPEFIRTILLGILAKLDAAIITINES